MDFPAFILGQITFGDQFFRKDIRNTGHRVNFLVENGLGKSRIVGLVVTVLSVAVDADHHAFPELLPVGKGRFGNHSHGQGIIAIDVKDWGFNGLGNVRTIQTRTRRRSDPW